MRGACPGRARDGGWAHLKRADCRRTTRLIIYISLELEQEWQVCKIKAERRFFELSEGESGRMAAGTSKRTCHVPLSLLSAVCTCLAMRSYCVHT